MCHQLSASCAAWLLVLFVRILKGSDGSPRAQEGFIHAAATTHIVDIVGKYGYFS